MNTLVLALMALFAAPAQDGVRYPARPGPREFILDEAKLIGPDQAAEIRILCEEALNKEKAPIIVVTLPSLAAYGAPGWPIERYALNLMSEWGVGWEAWNYGMLLLVSPGDRKARIELGGSWARRKDEDAQRVLRERIIPRFKQGDYSKGILEGVRGLHDIAFNALPSRAPSTRSAPVPAPVPGVPSSIHGCLPIGGCGLVLLVIVGVIGFSLVLRMLRGGGVTTWGSGGPGYSGGGYYGGGGFGSSFGGSLLGSALGSMLYDSFSRHSSSSSMPGPFSPDTSSPPSPPPSSDSGDWGGGSFGGGFSGGGGATGEW